MKIYYYSHCMVGKIDIYELECEEHTKYYQILNGLDSGYNVYKNELDTINDYGSMYSLSKDNINLYKEKMKELEDRKIKHYKEDIKRFKLNKEEIDTAEGIFYPLGVE